MRFKIFAFVVMFCFQVSAACLDWVKSKSANLPLCPSVPNAVSGLNLVPENFPLGAIVVSESPRFKSPEKIPSFAEEVAEKVLKGAGGNTPLILMAVSDSTFSRMKDRIDALPITPQQKAKWKSSILQVPSAGYTWQQDYMQPYINSADGKIILRNVVADKRPGDSFSKVTNSAKGCNIEAGNGLDHPDVGLIGGVLGGNIETLPGGICLLGSDNFKSEAHYEAYAKDACADSRDRIRVPTSWLKVGHTDEIMKVVRNNTKPAPCNFSIAIASPKKALELLKKSPNDEFFGFPKKEKKSSKDAVKEQIESYRGTRAVCRDYEKLSEGSTAPKKNQPGQPRKGVSKLRFLESIANEKAFAVVESEYDESSVDCTKISNGEAYEIFNSGKFRDYNQLIQDEMDQLKVTVQSKLKKNLPQCNVDFIDVPDVFFGGQVVEGDKKALPVNMGLSVLPNPTNSISINDTIISPEPMNQAFKRYIDEQYRTLGLKTDFVDTFDYAHIAEGNLHCSTNTMYVCQPKGRK